MSARSSTTSVRATIWHFSLKNFLWITYAPGIIWSFLIGVGGSILWTQADLARRWPSPNQAKIAVTIILLGVLTLAYSSTLSQISSWRFATHFAKNTVDFL
jgi:hypothetical protein